MSLMRSPLSVRKSAVLVLAWGEVRADVVFIDTYGILRKRVKTVLRTRFPDPLVPFPCRVWMQVCS